MRTDTAAPGCWLAGRRLSIPSSTSRARLGHSMRGWRLCRGWPMIWDGFAVSSVKEEKSQGKENKKKIKKKYQIPQRPVPEILQRNSVQIPLTDKPPALRARPRRNPAIRRRRRIPFIDGPSHTRIRRQRPPCRPPTPTNRLQSPIPARWQRREPDLSGEGVVSAGVRVCYSYVAEGCVLHDDRGLCVAEDGGDDAVGLRVVCYGGCGCV
jgi:hypothetical protein